MKNKVLKCLLLALISLPALAQNRHSVSGYVKDNSNGEGLIGVSVYVREAETGVVTNPYGFYSLTLPDGKYTLVFTYIGYQKATREVVLDGDKTVSIEMSDESNQLSEVTISTQKEDENVRSIEMSVNKVEMKTIRKMPALLGEVDLIRSIQLLPGVTTVGDVRWWFLQQLSNLGLDTWFPPDLRVQRQNQETGKTLQFLSVANESTVIQRGDVIHIDCGLNYMGLSTDWQKMGYVLRPGEKDAPEGLKKALANTNKLQDALFTHIKPGSKGFEVYEATMADMKSAGIEAMIYSHSVGNQGHALGASIDFRRPAAGAPLEPPFREWSYTSIELNTSTPVPEWNGQKVTIMMEDDAYLTKDEMKWFRPRQTAFYLIR